MPLPLAIQVGQLNRYCELLHSKSSNASNSNEYRNANESKISRNSHSLTKIQYLNIMIQAEGSYIIPKLKRKEINNYFTHLLFLLHKILIYKCMLVYAKYSKISKYSLLLSFSMQRIWALAFPSN